MKINQAGINLIKSFEGRKLVAYTDQRGVVTIGYGHTGSEVKLGMNWSPDDAELALQYDIANKAEPILEFVTENINDNQFAALCSLCFNVGLSAVKKSKCLKLINEGKDPSKEWLGFCHINGVISNGLLRRRKAELELFHKIG